MRKFVVIGLETEVDWPTTETSVTFRGREVVVRPETEELARSVFELLVALARIDGEVSDEERSVLVRIASSLGIAGAEFESAYMAGIERADTIRKSRPDPR